MNKDYILIKPFKELKVEGFDFRNTDKSEKTTRYGKIIAMQDKDNFKINDIVVFRTTIRWEVENNNIVIPFDAIIGHASTILGKEVNDESFIK